MKTATDLSVISTLILSSSPPETLSSGSFFTTTNSKFSSEDKALSREVVITELPPSSPSYKNIQQIIRFQIKFLSINKLLKLTLLSLKSIRSILC
jgi:hypothetical protein